MYKTKQRKKEERKTMWQKEAQCGHYTTPVCHITMQVNQELLRGRCDVIVR